LDEAVKIYNEIISLDSENTEYYFQMERLYEELKDWDSLIKTIDKIVEYVDDIELYDKKRAGIYDEKLINYPIAIDEYNKILEKYGYDDNIEIVNRLRELYKLENRYEDLKNFLISYQDFIADEEEAVNVKLEIAEIYAEKFEDYQSAFETYKEILDMEPSNENAIKRLLLFVKEGKIEEEVYEYLKKTGKLKNWK